MVTTTNLFGKSTKRQQLEEAIANSQKYQEYGMNSQNFGGGQAGALGAFGQMLTVGIGAYQEYKQRQELAKLTADNTRSFVNFALNQGDEDLASFAENGLLTDETQQAYIMSKLAPNIANRMNNQTIPSAIQNYEYYKNLSPTEQLKFTDLQRNKAGEGSFIDEQGQIQSIPGYGKAESIKAGMTQTEKNKSDLNFKPNIAGQTTKAEQEAKNLVENQNKLPQQEVFIDNQLNVLKRLKTHPGLSSIVGLKSGGDILSYLGKKEPIAGTEAAGAKALYDQVQGQQFLQALTYLTGKGAVSEIEGTKAQKAVSSLQLSNSEKEFNKNLDIIVNIIEKGKKVLRKQANPQNNININEPSNNSINKSVIIRKYNPQTGRIE